MDEAEKLDIKTLLILEKKRERAYQGDCKGQVFIIITYMLDHSVYTTTDVTPMPQH